MTDFTNEPFTDFSDPANREAFQAALDAEIVRMGESVPGFIAGVDIAPGEDGSGELTSTNPCAPTEVVGVAPQCTSVHAERALEAAAQAFQTWRDVPAAERAAVLVKAAEMMRERKHEFSALMVLEVGKNWAEADGDTAEAIDFMDFYAREAIRWDTSGRVTPIAGEANELRYVPLGVGAVIPPWNFPNAILCGMTTAAIAAGNTVVLKPASDSPMIGLRVAHLLRDAGVPDGVLNVIPGPGSKVGETMVNHPITRFISFTGSKEVGLGIYEKASRVGEGQLWLKRVVAEMGGKDSILVDETADLDEAAAGVLSAAYGYTGQKCSACSRAIVHKDVYDEFVERLQAGVAEVSVGDTRDNPAMGPLVSQSAYQTTLDYIAIGSQEGELLAGGKAIETEAGGYYVEPTIFTGIAPDARLSQEEIFGPVLAVIPCDDFEHGIEVFNNTEYGLTGALYTGLEDRIEEGKRRLHVGNLYFNRKCTGALVGAHPFGGFNMSGTDSKAGGADYLGLFLQAKTISTKT